MFRQCSQVLRRHCVSINHSATRQASSSAGGGGGFKVVAGTVLVTGGAVGGVVGYCAVDEEFRKTVEAAVPGSDDILNTIIGEKTPAKPVTPPPPPPSKLKIKSPVVVTKPKEEPKPVETSVAETKPSIPAPEKAEKEPKMLVPLPPPEEPTPTKEVEKPKVVVAEEPKVVEAAAPVEKKVEEPQVEIKKEVAPVENKEEAAPVEIKEEAVPVEIKEEAAPVEIQEEAAPVKVKEEVAPVVPAHDIENSSLELMLEELCHEMEDVVNVAVNDYSAAASAVSTHISIMEKVLESNVSVKDEAAWNEMFTAARNKSDKNKLADLSNKKALAAISNVLESVKAGRNNKMTAINPRLIAAEEAANKASYQLDQAKVKISSIQSEAKIMEDYRDIVEAGRQEFQKEIASIMPDVKLGEQNSKLTEEELNMFITHAYKKVMFLQQELAKQQTVEQERFRKALEKQRMDTTSLAVEQLESELEKQARELTLEQERRLASVREEAETELRVQMKRQAAAHADHITDVLSVQEAELVRKYKQEHEERIDSLTSQHSSSLARLQGVVGGLTVGLEERAASDQANRSAQALWVAATSLNSLVMAGNSQATTWEGKLQPLGGAVEGVRKIAGEKDSFVKTILSSIPSVALERGVYTEDSLKERFFKVESTARKVAGVGEEGGSLLTFALSYLQSKLLVDLTERAPVESLEVVDLATISSYELLSLARHNMDRGNLARTVQLMTQLRGEAARVCSDWLVEARLTLETRQAASVLLAHSLVTSANTSQSV